MIQLKYGRQKKKDKIIMKADSLAEVNDFEDEYYFL